MRKKSLILSAFVISVLLAGACAVLVSDEENSAALPRSISILPASGDVGTTVTVTGSGFNAEEVITILFADAVVATDPSVVETDGSGAFTATFVVPSNSPGTYVVRAYVYMDTADADFVIEQYITISPASGPVGKTVTVKGYGFAVSSPVTVTFDGVSVIAGINTDGSGAFTATFEVPSQPLGNYTIVATVAGKSGSAVFTIAEDSGGGGSNIALIAGAAAAAVAVLLLAVYFVFVKKP